MKRGVLWATAVLVAVNLLALLVFLVRAPGGKSAGSGTNSLPDTGGQPGVYAVTGVVKALRADGSNVVIRHERIPGFMEAMTMSFTARDPREVGRLQTNDTITFRLLVTDDESWIDSIERIGVAEPPPAFDYEQSRVVRDVEPLEIGQVMPDYVFTNQFGAATRLSDFRGQVLGLTFIFTRCPLPDFCPRMLKNFSAVAEDLARRTDTPTNWHLITLTIDPAYDTPAVMRTQAERYRYDARRWTFLTGSLYDIDALTEQVGLVFRRQSPDALPDHNLRTLAIDAQGRLRKIIVGNTWTAGELIEDLVAASRTDP